jgi:hypothetical protein
MSVAVRQPRISARCRLGSADALSLERGDRGGDHLHHVARRQVDPAGERDESAVFCEVPQIALHRLYRVEIALGERVQSRCGRAERVEQRDLHDLVAPGVGGDEVARLADVHGDAARAEGLAGIRGEFGLDELDDPRIELDGVDRRGVEEYRLQHVGTGAGAEHEDARAAHAGDTAQPT